jgi:hypothetical protein
LQFARSLKFGSLGGRLVSVRSGTMYHIMWYDIPYNVMLFIYNSTNSITYFKISNFKVKTSNSKYAERTLKMSGFYQFMNSGTSTFHSLDFRNSSQIPSIREPI